MNRLIAGQLNRCLAGLSLQQQRNIHLTPLQSSVFTKKIKKLDPALAKMREERKRNKLTKEIRSMQKHSKKPKPLDEMYIDVISSRNLNERSRTIAHLPFEELERRALVHKQYSTDRTRLCARDQQHISSVLRLQTSALAALKGVSEELYQAAIQPDPTLVPSTYHGPPETPPIDNYESPDGDYVDTTRMWE
uniref:Large ribosomal subunit protein mL40 n=1 Tax=Plectus sambesii TaxID=2011161 RepID=A0A914WKF5_9BILA